MRTTIDVTIWLDADPHLTTHTHGEMSWVDVDSGIRLHAEPMDDGEPDLDTLERFFRRGLDSILSARQPALFDDPIKESN